MRILHKHAFSSDLKRMTAVAIVEATQQNPNPQVLAIVKGAPEVFFYLFILILGAPCACRWYSVLTYSLEMAVSH